MRNGIRTGVVTAGALLVATLLAAPAAAASAPPNDDFAHATPVSLPYTEVVDTTGMTVGDYEMSASTPCDYPAEAGGVWYTLTGTGDPIVIDVSGTNYDVFVAVGVGPLADGTFTDVAICDVRGHVQNTEPGKTYYVFVYDEDLADGVGGSLHISFFNQPAPPKAELTVGHVARINRHLHVIRVHGTYACTPTDEPVGLFLIYVDVIQRVRGHLVAYFGMVEDPFLDPVCDGTTRRWVARLPTADPDDTPAPRLGRARVQIDAQVCSSWACLDITTNQRLVLKRLHPRRR